MSLTTTGIHYDSAGSGDAVVFLHGVTLDGRMWCDQVTALEDRYRCITVDRRGHGRSEPLHPGYDPIGDLELLLTEAGVSSCCVVGHSLGGWDAIRLAHRRPRALTSLLLVDPWFPLPPMRWAPPVETVRRGGVVAGRAAWLADPVFESAVREPGVRARLSQMVEGNDLGLWATDVPTSEQSIPPDELAATTLVPTLVVAGALDLPGFVDVANWLAANITGSVASSALLVQGAGHMLPMEAPRRFNDILESFLTARAEGKGA